MSGDFTPSHSQPVVPQHLRRLRVTEATPSLRNDSLKATPLGGDNLPHPQAG
jgi:hypothetical protein